MNITEFEETLCVLSRALNRTGIVTHILTRKGYSRHCVTRTVTSDFLAQ